jgi:hypothetical protein
VSHCGGTRAEGKDGRLRAETSALLEFDRRGEPVEADYVVGFEIEVWLADHGCRPSPIDTAFLDTRFNVEFNCEPLPLRGDVLSRSLTRLTDLWRRSNAVAHGLDANIILIGTLPNLRDEDLCLANLSPLKRYAALNSEALRQRGGRSLTVDIEGEQHLRSTHRDVMLEVATTSFQTHLQTPRRLAHRYFNAASIASAPGLAAAANAPFVFGLDLCSESRIPLFDQAVPLTNAAGALGRVTFGGAYVQHSLSELFVDNLDFPPLLPILFDNPPQTLRHLWTSTLSRGPRSAMATRAQAEPGGGTRQTSCR